MMDDERREIAGDAEWPSETTNGLDEVEALREKWLRAAAELDNLRKRAGREIARVRRHERETMLRGLLEIADNFDRALTSCADRDNPWHEGFEAIRRQLHDLLKRYGAEPFEALGEPFDPERHEAVSTIRSEEYPEGIVVEVLQEGYRMEKNGILRPARVIVVKNDA
jgi:molecular chaperone GrpE